ncbi:MAG TPA: 3'-5' exonuclease [Candidatus Hydrothermia bacterium]|nr:3'-5' exonuclease [Candidatus Hydrothermia bacterium]
MIVPENLGKYKILEFLGSGSFGSVYFAEDTILKKNVALKVQPNKGERGEKLIQEARILFELNHENIVRFFTIETIDDKIVMVMEPVRGYTLRDVIENKAPLEVTEALNIIKEILKALEYAHGKGLIHGDIKPENVLISEDTGKIKLADFGLARIFKQGQTLGNIGGTPFYMAPEVWKGESYVQSDIYSVGALLFELLTKKFPFSAENIEELRNKVFNARIENIPAVSLEVNTIIKSALSKNHTKRPSAGEMLSSINKILKTPELDIVSLKKVQKDISFGNLSPEQIKFVEDPSKVIILKGIVGSGKTTALAYKVAYYIKKQKEDPQGFLFLTFTGKAVNIFRSLIEKMLDEDSARAVSCLTFHEFGKMILKYAGDRINIPEDFKIITDKEGIEILRGAGCGPHTAKAVLREIKLAKSNLITPERIETSETSDWKREISSYYKIYQNSLLKNKYLDYEDLIFHANVLLQNYPDVCEDIRERFKFIIVDEFQDVNNAIFQMILHVAGEAGYLWVSGDETQSIYTFRGASPVYLNMLTSKFPKATKYFFTKNFRTAQKILEGGYNLIMHCKEFTKTNLLASQLKDEGSITFSYSENEQKEAEYVAEKIKELREQGFDYADIAVIYRINEYSHHIEEVFKKFEIPYTILEGGNFYDLPEIQAITAILKHISGMYISENMEVLLYRFLKTPRSAITKILKNYTTTGKLSTSGISDENAINALKSLQNFLKNSQSVQATDQILEQFINLSERENWLTQKSLETLQEFSLIVREQHLSEPREVLNFISLMKEIGVSSHRHHGVLLLTAHKAKGLEFPVVFITGLVEGLFPLGKRAIRKDHLEEERRLLYVALTRAQLRVYLTYPLYYKNEKMEPSRFILELTKRS